MDSVLIKKIYEEPAAYAGKEILIEGWVRSNRSSNKFGFIELNDGSCFRSMQVVYEEEKVADYAKAARIPISAGLSVRGVLKLTPEAKQPFELHAAEIVVEAGCDGDYPLQKKRHSLEFLREIAYLRPRSNTFSAVFRVRSLAAYAIHKFFQERDYIYVHTPMITGSDCEGAGEMFRVTTLDMEEPPRTPEGKIDLSQDFFGKETNLTVSGQLEAEIFALAFRNVYTFGPAFRAENSNTARHASEFWMIEPEMAFADLQENMRIAEEMIKYIIGYVLDNAPQEMAFFNEFIDKGLLARLDNILSSEFHCISYTEAVELLLKSGKDFQYPVSWGVDLQTEHERYITEEIFRKPVFVTDYPKDIKAFYMRLNDDGKTVAAMDLLVPGVGEIIGGSQREERHDMLLSRIREMGLREEDYWWYLNLRRYGGVKHSGYGLGFDRILMYMTGMSNIRDVQPFPRTPKSAEF
ncbi:MAG: asparagine--tRNA ligase [Bacillota bacterium]|nr:asparagine--tRNA ligase [Bacillota bacterium]